MKPLLWFALPLAACGGAEPAPTPTQDNGPEPGLGFERWLADYPTAIRLAPRVPGRWYDRTRRQALEKVIQNLQGNCSREAWLFAKAFFDRAPEEAVEPLIETMDRAFLSPSLGVLVQNTVEAMGRMRNPRFAPALMRALEHPSPGTREAAIQALAWSGTPDAVRQTYTLFPRLDLVSRRHWLASARQQLGAAATPLFAQLLDDPDPSVRPMVVDEILKMPADVAAGLLRPIWPETRGALRVTIAGILHRNGDGAGTAVLQQALRQTEDPGLQRLAAAAVGGDPGPLLDDLLRLTIHRDGDLRLAAVSAIAGQPGESVREILRVLTADESELVRREALKALAARGHRQELDRIVDRLRTATGTALSRALDVIIDCRDGEAVPVIMERYRKTPPGEGRGFLQAIAFTHHPAAFAALWEVFVGPERALEPAGDSGPVKTSLNYLPTLMLNVRGAGAAMIERFRSLPPDDHLRRAYMLEVLGGVAADGADPEIAAQLTGVLREVLFDRRELPQMRLAALGMLERSLTLDDAMQLKRSLSEEAEPMRKALSDFLFDRF